MDQKDKEILTLKAENDSLKKILSLVPGNVYWKDRSGKYLGCNEGNAKIINLKSPHGIVGKTVHELVEPEYAIPIEQIDDEVMATALERTVEEYGPDPFGNHAIYLTRKVPLQNEEGKTIGLVGLSVDITERKKLEEELKQSKKIIEDQKDTVEIYLNNLLENLLENVYWMDKEGNILLCNDRQATCFGLSSTDAIIGKNIYDMASMLGWDKKFAETIRKNDLEVIASGKPKATEEVAIINGEAKTFMSYKHPLLDKEKNIIGVFGLAIDITERKKMEQELRTAKEQAEAALAAKEIAEAESREKSLILKNVLEDLKEKERYYLSGEHKGLHLTQREAQCLVCLAHGYSVKQIGKSLELSPRTVEVYIERMKVKLKCSTKAELIAKAIECRFLEGIRPVVPIP